MILQPQQLRLGRALLQPQQRRLGRRRERKPVRGMPTRHMVHPRDVAMAVPLFPRSFRPSNRRKRWIAHVMELAKLVTTFFVADSVVFARYSDFRYLVVWV